jgi:hypothetical protein
MKKWLITEAVLLTIVPTLALLYAIPIFLFAAAEIFVPIAGDANTLLERSLRMLPYAGGFWGLWTVWRYAVLLSKGERFSIDWRFWGALIGGALASRELITTPI